MQLRYLLKTPLRSLGYDIVKLHRTTSPAQRRQLMLASHQVDLVLDVGADVGTYARELRANGYAGRIISFEPRTSAFQKLKANTASDRHWEARQAALGKEEGTATINVSRNAYSSSLLPILPSHLAAEPEAEYIGSEEVPVTTLAAFLPGAAGDSRKVFLKIDTQGFERNVLEGARDSIDRICGLQMELSLRPLYQGETLFTEMLGFVQGLGFQLKMIQPGISDPISGEMLQADAIFFRPRS
jgi:FkbM family methyltransferase